MRVASIGVVRVLLLLLLFFLPSLLGCGRDPAPSPGGRLWVELLPPDSIRRTAGRMDLFRRMAKRVRLRVGEGARVLCDRVLSFPMRPADALHCGLTGHRGKQLRLAASVSDRDGRVLADAESSFKVADEESGSLVVKLTLRVPVKEFDVPGTPAPSTKK